MGGAGEQSSVWTGAHGRGRRTRRGSRTAATAIALVAVALVAASGGVALPAQAQVPPATDARPEPQTSVPPSSEPPSTEPPSTEPTTTAPRDASEPAPAPDAPQVGSADADPCVRDVWNGVVNCTYAYSGSMVYWQKPPDVGKVNVFVSGAAGGTGVSAGGGNVGTGGKGGYIAGTIDVTPFPYLAIAAGSKGGPGQLNGISGEAGWPNGGFGGGSTASSSAGCGGGGSSTVSYGGITIFEAGGGGGCGGYFTPMNGAGGGFGGATGGGGGTGATTRFAYSCDRYAGTGGGGGSATGGGAAGAQGSHIASDFYCYNGGAYAAAAGRQNWGGNGAHAERTGGGGGGGGGGGWYGGGGGGGGENIALEGSGGGGGGGGGANGFQSVGWATLGTQLDNYNAGDGSVTIQYFIQPVTMSIGTVNNITSIEAGHQITFVATLTSPGAATAHTGTVNFYNAFTGVPLCEGSAITPTLVSHDSSQTVSQATCTFGPYNTSPPPPQCVPDTSVDPPPPLPAECTYNSSTIGPPLYVAAQYTGAGATSDAGTGMVLAEVTPITTYTYMLGSPEPNAVRGFVYTGYSTPVPIDGTLTFYDSDNTTVEGCVDLPLVWAPGDEGGVVTCHVPPIPGKTRTLHAKYTGGTNTKSSDSSNTVDLTADPLPTTMSLAVVDGPRTYGYPLTMTATVALQTPTPGVAVDGTVTFTDLTTGAATEVPGCVDLPVPAGGTVSCTIARPIAGNHVLHASYAAGTQTKGSASLNGSATFTAATPRVAIAADPPGGSTAGQTVALTARVEMSDAGGDHVAVTEGTVTFKDGTTDVPGCVALPVNQPTVTCSIVPTVTTGGAPHAFSARYLGSPNLTTAASSTLSYAVGLAPTTTTLAMVTPPAGPVFAGTAVTIRATVASGAGATPAGNVAFFDNGQPLAACPPPRAVDGSGQATCTFVPSAGTTHALTAAYQPTAGGTTAASTTASPLSLAVGRYNSTTSLTAAPTPTPTGPLAGEDVTLTATVKTAAGAPTPTGTIAFADGGTTLAGCGAVALTPVVGSTPKEATATCTIQPGGGAHTFGASYGGDVPTKPSTAAGLAYTLQAGATTTEVSALPSGAAELTLTATVAPVAGHGIPTGTVDLGVDGAAANGACDDVALVASANGATASCAWTGDPTATHEVDATYTPGNGDFTGSTGSFSYVAPVLCRPGEVALWTKLNATPSGVIVADGDSSMTLAVGSAPGVCGVTPVPFTASSISLFGGMLTGNGSGVLTGGGDAGSICLTDGSLDSPEWMRVPTLAISSPICFAVTDDGGLGASTTGELGALGPEGQFPFVDLDDTPVMTASFIFTADGENGTSQLELRFVAGPADEPVLDMSLVVASDGSFTGSLDTPGLVLLDQSLSTLHVEISGGAGAPLTVAGSVTLGSIAITDGVSLDELTISLDVDGFTVEGVATVGVGEHLLELAATGSVTDSQNWSFELSVKDTEAWEPLPGLALTPNLTGTISRTDGAYAFDIQGGDPDGSPLVTWQPAPGASLAVQTIQLSSMGAECAAVPDDPEHEGDLVLAFAGEITLGDVPVEVEGCADLTIGAYHFDATVGDLTVGSMTVSNLELHGDGAVGAGLTLEGGGDADIEGHAVHLRFALTTTGTLVVGASVDLETWGIPVQGFVAYASTDVEGFDTGDPNVGDEGVIDLTAGLTAVGDWTPTGEVDDLLSTPAPDGLGLTPGGTVHFEAHLGGGSIVFHASISAPDDLPFLTLPGGTTIDAAELTFTREGTGPDATNVLELHLEATVDGTTAVTIDLVLGLTDGTFTGEVDVTDLALFGRTDIALHGTIERTAKDPGPGFEVAASVSGSIGSEEDPIEVAESVSFTHLDLTLGTAGVAIAGDVVIAGKTGLTVEGHVFTEADDDAGFGPGGWSLEVSTSDLEPWSPTDGVTFTADLHGSIAKKTKTAPVGFRLDATGSGGGDLFTFAPEGAPVTVAVKSVSVGNETPAPGACATRAGDIWLSIAGSFTATIGSQTGTATASGCFDLTSGQTAITADLSSFSVDLGGGTRIRGPRFTIARGPSTPAPAPGTSRYKVTAEVSLDVDLLGSAYTSPEPGSTSSRLTAQLSYRGGTFVVGVRANLGSYGLGGVGGDVYLYVASAPVTGFDTGDPNLSKIDPKTGAKTTGKIDLVKGVNLVARLTLPTSVTDGLGKTGGGEGVDAPDGAVTAIGQIDAAAKAFIFKVQFQSGIGGQELLRTGDGTRLTLDGGYLKFTVKKGAASFGLGIDVTLHLPPVDAGGEESTVPMAGELTVSNTGITVSLQLGRCGSPENSWRNAFGIDGLTVECAGIQGGVSYAGVPTVGFFGKVTSLPSDVSNAIGYQQGSPIKFAMNLNPMMLSLSIGEKDSDTIALKPLQAFGKPDFFQVRYASLYVAPVAVTIGDQSYPAGFGIAFQASISGVDVDIMAAVDPTTPSLQMKASVSEIELGALKIGPASIDLLASPTEFHFKTTGTLSLGPGTVDIGDSIKIGGELKITVSVSILPDGFEATLEGHAKVELSALLPQEMCYWYGQIPIPCSFTWQTTNFEVTVPKTGFRVDGSGITLIAGGFQITMLWTGGLRAYAAGSLEAKLERLKLEAELHAGTDKPNGGTDAVEDPSTSPADPAASPAVAPAPDRRALAPVGAGADASSAAAGSAQAAEDELTVVAPEASDDPMAEAPLPDDLVVSASSLVSGMSLFAAPSGPNPAGELEQQPDTTPIVVDSSPVPELADGTAPGSWTATGALATARTSAAVALLPDGRVLAAGGAGANGPLASAEVYDPSTGTWSPTGSLAHARSGAAMAVLPDGRVLVAGGTDGTSGAADDHALASVELYDPATGRWSAGDPLSHARAYATATVLTDGSVLVAGGLGGDGVGVDGPLATAERFDPSSGRWHAVGSLASARGLASASRLADGRVLVVGGQGASGASATAVPLASAELFDPATETWATTTAMPTPSMLDTATTLADGRVLVAGSDSKGKVFDPATATWSWTGAMGAVRAQAAAVTLPDGKVLLIGGTGGGQVQADGVIYDPATNTWQLTEGMPVGAASAGAAVLADGSVLAVGGADRSTPLAATSRYRQPADAISAPAAPAPTDPVATVPATGQLPSTGADVFPLLLLSFGLLSVGTVAVATTRRRRTTRTPA